MTPKEVVSKRYTEVFKKAPEKSLTISQMESEIKSAENIAEYTALLGQEPQTELSDEAITEAIETEKKNIAEAKELESKVAEYISICGKSPQEGLTFEAMNTAIEENKAAKLKQKEWDDIAFDYEKSIGTEASEEMTIEIMQNAIMEKEQKEILAAKAIEKAKSGDAPDHILESAKKYFEQYQNEKEVYVSGDGNFFKSKDKNACLDHAIRSCNEKYYFIKK